MYGEILYEGLDEADVVAYMNVSAKHLARVIVRGDDTILDVRKITIAPNGRIIYSMNGIRIRNVRIKTLYDYTDDINAQTKLMTRGEFVDFQRHIGGLVYVNSDYGLIGIRAKFIPSSPTESEPKYTRCGVSLKPQEWPYVSRLISKLREIIPTMMDQRSCIIEGHGNQMAIEMCTECNVMGTITID